MNCPGRNADAVAEMAVALLFAVSRRVMPADGDVRAGEVYQRREHPLPAVPGLGAGRPDRRFGRPGRGRASHQVAVRGARHEGRRLRPVHGRGHPFAPELLEVSDVVSMHAPVTPETTRMIGAEQFAAMKDGAMYLEHSPGQAARHRRAGRLAAIRSPERSRTRSLRGRAPAHRPPAGLRWPTWSSLRISVEPRGIPSVARRPSSLTN